MMRSISLPIFGVVLVASVGLTACTRKIIQIQYVHDKPTAEPTPPKPDEVKDQDPTFSYDASFNKCDPTVGVKSSQDSKMTTELFTQPLMLEHGAWKFGVVRDKDGERIQPKGWRGVFTNSDFPSWTVDLDFSEVTWTPIPGSKDICGMYEIKKATGNMQDAAYGDFIDLDSWKTIFIYQTCDSKLLFPKSTSDLLFDFNATWCTGDPHAKDPNKRGVAIAKPERVSVELHNACE